VRHDIGFAYRRIAQSQICENCVMEKHKILQRKSAVGSRADRVYRVGESPPTQLWTGMTMKELRLSAR
jgi:hypothetical protein